MWYNIPMAWLLRSPLYGLLGKSILLITVRGRKSGKFYSTPLNFVADHSVPWVVSLCERTWWRNLRGGAPVKVVLSGKTRSGQGEAIEELDAVTEGLVIYLQKVPGVARYFDVGLDASGQLLAEDLCKAASERVLVSLELDREG